MKKTFILTAAASVLLGTSFPLYAQSVVTETTTAVQPTETIGTVSEYTPDAIVIRSESAAPTRYTFTKTTEYVDETGQRVTADVVRSGAPVTVRYIREGDRLVASRVIVRRATVVAPAPVTTTTVVPSVEVKKTTTTTTTSKEKDKD